jgi:hypothetical protein
VDGQISQLHVEDEAEQQAERANNDAAKQQIAPADGPAEKRHRRKIGQNQVRLAARVGGGRGAEEETEKAEKA